MVAAMANEIAGKIFPETAEIKNEIINTIYFGGGTPSLLSKDELQILMDTIRQHNQVADDAEITLEANPDDIAAYSLNDWKKVGINRLSIGVQSFRDQDLRWINRAHSAQQSIESIEMAQDKGYNNISVDLIYGLPEFPNEVWQQNVEKALALDIPHLSCYALTVEPKTALENFIHTGKSKPVDPELQSTQFLLLMNWLNVEGFEHYEISNFAKPNYRSRHNSSYWQGKPYFGFGPSAHSFDGQKTRWWNVANNALYLSNEGLRMEDGKLHKEQSIKLMAQDYEVLNPKQQLNEYIMISLRTIEGIELDKLKAKSITEASFQAILKKLQRWKNAGKIIISNNCIQLTKEGKLFADGIAADLFF